MKGAGLGKVMLRKRIRKRTDNAERTLKESLKKEEKKRDEDPKQKLKRSKKERGRKMWLVLMLMLVCFLKIM